MAVDAKDYVKDIEKKDNLKQELRDRIDDENFVQKLDQDVEKSFQQFTESIKSTLTGSETREELQDRFNGRLDRQMANLDSFENNEIARDIIGPTTFELQKFKTATELGIFQTQLNEQKDNTQRTEIVSVKGGDLHINTFKDESGERVDPNKIAELFNKNFERRDDLLNLLKQGGIGNVKKFQRIVSGLKEDGSEDQIKGRNTLLGTFGVDGRFGGNTMKAFENYISSHDIASAPKDEKVQATADMTMTQEPAQAKGSPAVHPEASTTQTSDIDNYEHDINGLSEINEAKAREIVQKTIEAGRTAINLHGLKKLSKEVATVLAGFEGELYLNGLKDVNEDVLNEFKQGKCTMVQFPGGTLEKKDNEFSITIKNGSTHTEITSEICSLLVNKVATASSVGGSSVIPGGFSSTTQAAATQQGSGTTTGNKTGGSSTQPASNEALSERGGMAMGEHVPLSSLTVEQKQQCEKNKGNVRDIVLNQVFDQVYGGESGVALGLLDLDLGNDFASGSKIILDNQDMSVKDFLTKLREGSINYRNLNADIERSDNLANKTHSADGSELYFPVIQNIKFSEKTESNNTETNGIQFETSNSNNGNSVEIAYDADTLIFGLKKGREARSEMDALKLLLGLKMFRNISEELSYSIEGYELKGQEKKDLKNLRNTLRLFTNNHETTVTISDFFKLAAEQYSTGEGFDISKLGKEPSHKGTKKSYERFGELYAKYRKQEGGPYFKKVMGIMENYFLRGDVDEKSIKDLYNMENIGTWEGFIDPDKEKEVFRGLFDGKNVGVDLGVTYQSSEQLKTLKKIVKKINLNELFKSGKLDGKGNNLGKREKQFYDLYQSYKKGELQGDNYYKKVFDFLVGAGRGNTTIVDAINAVNLIKIADVDFDEGGDGIDSKDEIHYNSEEEKKFILLLSDFNHDARVDGNDNGLKMGQQLRNIYKSINIDLNNAGLDDQLETGGHVWSNILSFAKQYFNNISNPDMAKKLDGIGSVEDLNKKIQEDSTILITLQNMLKNSSISINSICRYGDRASEMFMKELMQDSKVDEQYNRIFEGLKAQGVSPTAKQALKPILLGSLMDNSVGIGLGAAYDAGEVGSFSAVLGVSDVPGMGETVGLVVGYGNSIPVGDKRTIDLGASGGVSYASGFVPMFSVYAGTSVRVSDGLMNKDFDATTLTKIHAGANFTMIGTVPSWGLSAGVSMDKLNGIDKQESMLRPNITSVISEFLNDTEITGDIFGSKEITDEQKEKCINNIREKLGNKYGKMDEDLLDKAANNLYMGFAYYAAETDFANMSEQDQKAIKDKIINNIVNNYVTQRRNDKIEELNGKTTVSDVTVGVQFLAGYWPIPMLGVTFTKYSNLYSRETPESVAEYESVLSTGQGMGYLERSVDQNGNILPAAIKYLNEKMSVASKYDLQKMQIQFKEMTENGETKNVIFIPRELCNSVNISMDPEIKDFVKSTPEGFEIPVNTQLSLLTYTRTDATKFNLVIGDHKRESGDIDLNIKSEFEGDPLKYEAKNGRPAITKYKINEDMSELYTIEDFPLSECTQVKDGNLYFDINVPEIQCVGENIKVENGKLVVPYSANLVITKTIDGKYKAECTYFIKGFDTRVVYIDVKKNVDVETSHDIENLFESYKELNSIFGDIEKKLSKMDDRAGYGAYAAFMNAAAETGLDGELDNTDYDTAFKNLKKILGKLKDDCFDGLRGKIEDPNITDGEMVMIVDRFKAIFSYNDKLVNKHNLELQLKGRGDRYKDLYGYDRNEPFPLKSNFDYRKAVQEKLSEKGKFEKVPNPNLVGMTAFYRLGDKNAGRSYMMTELGGTYVLGGEMIPIIDSSDLELTKKWFENNLDKSGVHKDLLKASLSTKLKSIINVKELSLSDENLKSILAGEYIDIGEKKVKINVKYMFYLLGECANESIGVNLEQVIVKDKKNLGGTTIADITPELTYEGVSGVYSGSAEAMSRYEIGNSNSATLGFAVGKGKQTETEDVIGKDHTEPGENQDPSNNQTEVNENIDPNNNEGGGINLGGESNDQIQIEHEQNNGGLIGHGPGNNGETGSFFGREPRLDPNGGGINLGGEMPTLTPGTYKFTDNLGNHVVTITETEDSYIVHTVTTPLPQHGHALTASQSETHSETKVVKKEK